MKFVKKFLSFLFFSIHAFAELAPGDTYYTLEAGDVRTVAATDIERIAIGTPEIVSYKVLDDGQLLLIAQKAGNTAMQVWRQGDRVSTLHFQVRESGTSLRARELKQVLGGIPGIKVSEINGRILLEGKVNKADSEMISRIAQSTPGVISMVKEEDFAYLPLLRIDVRIVEVSKKASSQLGLKWDSSAGGPIVGVSTAMAANPLYALSSSQETRVTDALGKFTSLPLPPRGDSHFYGYAGITSSLGSQIDVMAQTGEARLLATPKLVAKSGEEAHFLSGGSFPVQIVDELGRPSISFQEYGIKLQVKPFVDDKNRISTNIAAEVSSLDFSVAINGVPGLLSRKVDSVINVNDSDTIVISGLASSQDSRQVTKVPFLGDLPVVGGLFRSTGKSDQQTELVILLTPHIVSPGDRTDAPLQAAGREFSEGFKAKDINSALME
jgi:pilus assembly protein CpaC